MANPKKRAAIVSPQGHIEMQFVPAGEKATPAPDLSALWGLVDVMADPQAVDGLKGIEQLVYNESSKKWGGALSAALLKLGIPRPTPEGR